MQSSLYCLIRQRNFPLLTLIITLFLGACSVFSSPQTDPVLTLDIQAENNINPNIQGVPSPVVLRLYQLSDSQAFQDADFLLLYENDQVALKASLISARQLGSIAPNEKTQIKMPLNPSTKYIAIIAGFADYLQAKNKVIISYPSSALVSMKLVLDGLNMTLTKGEQK